MSGPKGASYEVVSPAEMRRRALQAANQRLAAAVEGMRSLQHRAAAQAAQFEAPRGRPVTTEPAEIDRQTEAVLAYCAKLEERLRVQRIAAAQRKVSASLAEFHVDLEITALRSSSPGSQQQGRDALRATLADLAGRLGELPDPDREQFVSRIAGAAKALDGPDSARAAQVVGSLRAAVTAALHESAEQASFERRRAAVAQAFSDVPDTDTNVWQTLTSAADDVELARARGALEEARAAASRAADQQFVLAQAAEVLQELGYRVEVSDAAGADELVARKEAWQHHGLRMVFPLSQSAFSSVPEAYGATDPRDDVAFEQASCRDVSAVLEGLARRGVQAQLLTSMAPGVQAVRRATPASTRRRTAAAPKERAL